jgi:hypothetical protein
MLDDLVEAVSVITATFRGVGWLIIRQLPSSLEAGHEVKMKAAVYRDSQRGQPQQTPMLTRSQ